jgi:hypothetical protein
MILSPVGYTDVLLYIIIHVFGVNARSAREPGRQKTWRALVHVHGSSSLSSAKGTLILALDGIPVEPVAFRERPPGPPVKLVKRSTFSAAAGLAGGFRQGARSSRTRAGARPASAASAPQSAQSRQRKAGHYDRPAESEPAAIDEPAGPRCSVCFAEIPGNGRDTCSAAGITPPAGEARSPTLRMTDD